jgi:putative tricarboxylic transport membrane protein
MRCARLRGTQLNESSAQRVDRSAMAIAIGLFVMAIVILWNALPLPAPVYGIGPRAMPILVASGLIVLAIANGWLAWRGDFPEREPYDAQALVLILGGVAALIAIIGFDGGFILATTALFAATATAFGRRAILTDLAIGFVLSITVYLMFTKVLTLSLPMGPLERLL